MTEAEGRTCRRRRCTANTLHESCDDCTVTRPARRLAGEGTLRHNVLLRPLTGSVRHGGGSGVPCVGEPADVRESPRTPAEVMHRRLACCCLFTTPATISVMSIRASRPLLLLALALLTVSTSGCFLRRPDFMIRTHPREVVLPDGTRAQLADRAAELEAQLVNGTVRGDERERAQRDLATLRTRLEKGDFQVGDQIVVTISREQVAVDTATVREGLLIRLASQGELPDLPLAGVLRSEVQPRVQAHLDRFVKDFTVRVTLLTRLGVMGGVSRPGYYGVSPDRPVTDILMAAGGPSPMAKLDRVTIRRNGRLIVKGSQWQTAVREGTTIAELGLQPGDEIAVEQMGQRMPTFQYVQIGLFAVSAAFALIQLLQFIYAEE